LDKIISLYELRKKYQLEFDTGRAQQNSFNQKMASVDKKSDEFKKLLLELKKKSDEVKKNEEKTETIQSFLWEIAVELLFPTIQTILIFGIFVSFAVWYFFTKMCPWTIKMFFLVIYPLAKWILPTLLASIGTGILYMSTMHFPLGDIWILYAFVWIAVYIPIHARIHTMK
jgi:hypothetical protein